MKLIIDIPAEKDFIDKALWGGIDAFDTDDLVIVLDAIAHGTPLDDVKLKIEQDMCFDMFNDYGNETAIHKELWEILDNIGKGDAE